MSSDKGKERIPPVSGPDESAIIELAADYVVMQQDAEARASDSETAAERGRKVHAAWTRSCKDRLQSDELRGRFDMGQVSLAAREGTSTVAKRADLRLLRGAREYVIEVQSSGEGAHKDAQRQARDLYLDQVATGPVSFYTVTARDGGKPALEARAGGGKARDLSAHLISTLARRRSR